MKTRGIDDPHTEHSRVIPAIPMQTSSAIVTVNDLRSLGDSFKRFGWPHLKQFPVNQAGR
jgi:hypothetical protein